MAEPLFRAPFRSFDTNDASIAVAVGDLNKDGYQDLSVTNAGSNTISVLLGSGDGTFQPAAHFASGTYPRSLIVADMNMDERLDVVATNEVSRTLSVLLGVGDGTLAPKMDFSTRGRPVSMTAGDWNDDGWPDVATVDQDSSLVSVLLGRGDGTLGAAVGFPTVPGPVAIASSDLNGDGHGDLVTINLFTASVLFGRGDGTFGWRADYANSIHAQALALGDVNGDQRPDVVIASSRSVHEFNSSTISVWLNAGDGALELGEERGAAGGMASVAVVDLDSDGHSDISAVYYDTDYFTRDSDSRLLVLRGHGDGTFEPAIGFSTGGIPKQLAVADLDSDDKLDLVVANWTGAVSVHRGNGDATFGNGAELPAISGRRPPRFAAVGDLNSDGAGDIVAVSGIADAILVALGNRDGTIGPWSVLQVEYDRRSLLLIDVNGDARQDIVTSNAFSSSIRVYLGKGDGSFEAGIATQTGANPASVIAGDLNGDGVVDLATANEEGGNVAVLLGQGDGTFDRGPDVGVTGRAYTVALGQLTGDEHLDFVVTSEIYGTGAWVSMFRGNGDGTFTAGRVIETVTLPRSLAIADLDRDSKSDLLVAVANPVTFFSDEIIVWRGDGNGGFALDTKLGVWGHISAVLAADFDTDSVPDIAVADLRANTVSVLTGMGDGGFSTRTDFGTGSFPTAMALGDLNADHHPDLVVPTPGSYTVTTLLNLTRSTAVLVEDLVAQAGEWSVHLHWTLAAEALAQLVSIRVQGADVQDGVYVEITDSPLVPARTMSFEHTGVVAGRDYDYRLILTDARGLSAVVGPVRARLSATLHERAVLYPPFVPEGGGPVQIRYAFAMTPTTVTIAIHDARGRRIWASSPQVRPPGEHLQAWDRRDTQGRTAPQGIYFVTLHVGSTRASVKLPLIISRGGHASGSW